MVWFDTRNCTGCIQPAKCILHRGILHAALQLLHLHLEIYKLIGERARSKFVNSFNILNFTFVLLPSLLPLCFCLLQLQPKCYTGHSSSTVLNNMFAGNAKHSLLTMYNVIYTFKAFVFRRVTVLYCTQCTMRILYCILYWAFRPLQYNVHIVHMNVHVILSIHHLRYYLCHMESFSTVNALYSIMQSPTTVYM